MNDASKYVLARLKERGYRMTKPRVETVVVLASAKGGLSLPELAQKVAGDEASVYRTSISPITCPKSTVNAGNMASTRCLMSSETSSVVLFRFFLNCIR